MSEEGSVETDASPPVHAESPDVPVSVAAVPPDTPEEVIAPVRPVATVRGLLDGVRRRGTRARRLLSRRGSN
ncbi:hypothetical protein [Halobaculum sp. D14]|uniref:hypothetical protein n=1 Tax=unclassified Halobaculum TaxID=2640896 RepID=UPI003EB75E0B